MLLGYNTNGFAFHRLDDAVEILAELGYRCVGLTLDVHHLDPFRTSTAEIARFAARLDKLGLGCVIETGSRYLLDPRRKHRPTLIDSDPAPRVRFLRRAAEIARDLGARCVSYWSGAVPAADQPQAETLFQRLAEQVAEFEAFCEPLGVKAALEPEPGMLLQTMADFDRLAGLLGRRPGLTLDVGHVVCMGDGPPEDVVRTYADVLHNIHLDDMRKGEHRHLFFGEGEVNFSPLFETFRQLGFNGPACVELSDASRNAVETAQRAMSFLSNLMPPEHRDAQP